MEPLESIAASRILIVDDDAAIRRVFSEVLRREGFAVQTASTAAEALREVSRWNPDAILLDYRMPDVTGLGFLYRLIAHQSTRTPVAVITGVADLDHALSGQLAELGVPVYFKPINASDLVALTQKLITPTIH
jgi:CheY-like chemotaxis protein